MGKLACVPLIRENTPTGKMIDSFDGSSRATALHRGRMKSRNKRVDREGSVEQERNGRMKDSLERMGIV